MMDRFYPSQSPEALAHNYLTCVIHKRVLCAATHQAHLFFPHSENWFSWDLDHPSLPETLIAGCAAYQAFSRYLTGADLYLPPRSRKDLEHVL
jgi:hypothetical protein